MQGTFLAQELELARHNLPPLEFEELRSLFLERAEPGDVQRAAAFYKVIRYSYGSGCTSFGCQPFDVRKTFHLIWQAADRLANTVIENKTLRRSSGSTTGRTPFFIAIRLIL